MLLANRGGVVNGDAREFRQAFDGMRRTCVVSELKSTQKSFLTELGSKLRRQPAGRYVIQTLQCMGRVGK